MDYLWTPWRYQYIARADQPEECIFCLAAAADPARDQEFMVVHRAAECYVILNMFPYTSGHVMVVPYAHVDSLAGLPEAAALDMMRLARRCEAILRKAYRPDGLNVGVNLGKSAGAGVAGHVHMHVLPRWSGDANFMTVTGETRVLPEDLRTTWTKLHGEFKNAVA
jgi:ATP adenylyltransferase